MNKIFTSYDDVEIRRQASEYIYDFPPISKEDNLEVIIHFIKQQYLETGYRITLDMLPDSAGGKWKLSYPNF